VFASDEEALAAAEEAYSKYISTIDLILAEGGAEPDRLRALASSELFELQKQGFASFIDRGWHAVGSTQLRNFTLQRYEQNNVTFYVCADISQVDVVDATGASQVTAERPSENAREAAIEWTGGRPVVTGDDVWAGGGVC
jgi:hypothetical protein